MVAIEHFVLKEITIQYNLSNKGSIYNTKEEIVNSLIFENGGRIKIRGAFTENILPMNLIVRSTTKYVQIANS